MTPKEAQQLLSGELKLDSFDESDSDLIFDILKKKFQDRYKKITNGFELTNMRNNTPLHFSFSVEWNKRIEFHIFPSVDKWYSSESKQDQVTKIGIWYEDAGVHTGSNYGNPTTEIRRYTTIKHIAKLIPKIEEIYGFIEILADSHRQEAIQNRIEHVQDTVSEKLHDLEQELNEIKNFEKKYASRNRELGEGLEKLLYWKETYVKREKERLQTLPEFTDPRKVLKID